MDDTEKDIFGWIGAVLIVSINIPQLIKLYRTKSGGDLSMITLILNITGSIFFLTYGILIDRSPIIMSNILIIIITIIIIILKKSYKNVQNEINNIYITQV
jgi:MtN3 and saliva related transmembrane protein